MTNDSIASSQTSAAKQLTKKYFHRSFLRRHRHDLSNELITKSSVNTPGSRCLKQHGPFKSFTRTRSGLQSIICTDDAQMVRTVFMTRTFSKTVFLKGCCQTG